MTRTLKSLVFELWKNNIDRQGILPKFTPVFERYIGIEDSSNYENILATLKSKAESDSKHTVLFDGEIKMIPDFNFITAIKNELATMNISQLETQNIKMYPDESYNKFYLENLQKVVNLAISKENFLNEGVRNNFICELLLNTANYILPLEIDSSYSNKCIYYGDIKKSNAYFLLLLAMLGFDVVYINSGKDSAELNSISNSNLIEFPLREATKTLREWSKSGIVIEQNNSVTLDLQNQMTQQLFTGTGVFRPWQFKENGTTKSLFFNSTIIDINQNWNEEAKVRSGFKVEGNVVNIPNFLWEIEGEYDDMNKYAELVNLLKNSKNKIFTTGKESDKLFDFQQGINENRLKLVFTQNSDLSFNIEKVKELPFYQYSSYNDSTENFILNKVNETIKDITLLQNGWTKDSILDFMMTCLSLSKEVIRVIDNFDYTSHIPKLIYFLEKDESLNVNNAHLIALFHKMGADVIVLSPSGMSDLSGFIKRDRYNTERLDKVVYDRELSQVKESKAKGFFKKIFS